MAVLWAALGREGVEEAPRTLGARETAALIQAIAAIDPHLAAALWEGQEGEVALGADGLHVGVPAVRALDQHAAEHVVRLVGVQGYAHGFAHHGIAAVGADQQPGARLTVFAVGGGVGHGRVGAGLDLQHIDAAQGLGADAASLVIEGLAMMRMADAQGARYVGGEDVQRDRARLGFGRRHVLVIGDVLGDEMSAGAEQKIQQAQAFDLGHAPGGNPLAAHLVLEHLALFEHEDGAAGARHGDGQGRAANAAADHDQIVVIHVSPHRVAPVHPAAGTMCKAVRPSSVTVSDAVPSGLAVKPVSTAPRTA